MRRLFVIYDARCGLCSWARRWALTQPAFVDLTFIPAGSDLANRLFPTLSRNDEEAELIAVSDQGGVYRDNRAWILCLYALRDYRELSDRLAGPLLEPFARRAFALVSKARPRISRWLNLASDAEIAETLARVEAPACLVGGEVVPTLD